MLLTRFTRVLSSSPKLGLNLVRDITWEPSRKGGSRYDKPDNRPVKDQLKEGLSLLKREIKVWTEEVKENLNMDPKFYLPGDLEVVWKFDSEELVKNWIVTADRDNNEGFSHCKFEFSKNKKGLFHGYIDKTLPKDGRIVKAGYCNLTSQRVVKSFLRETYLNWDMFTHLIMRVRGDGRPYMINLNTAGYYDIQWHDRHNFILYTRGGPYWQTAKIPFSKFLLSSKGRIQDKQCAVPLNRVSGLGITTTAKKSGHFQLEIDYIGVYFDGDHTEKFAYEMYQVPNLTVY